MEEYLLHGNCSQLLNSLSSQCELHTSEDLKNEDDDSACLSCDDHLNQMIITTKAESSSSKKSERMAMLALKVKWGISWEGGGGISVNIISPKEETTN